MLGSTGAATILFVCFVGPALLLTPAVAARRHGASARSAATSPRRSCSPAARCARCSPRGRRPPAVVYAATAAGRRRLRRRARCSRWRCCPTSRSRRRAPHRREPGRRLHRRLDRRARPSASPSGPALYALVLALGGYVLVDRRSTVAQPDSARHRDRARLLAASRRRSSLLSLLWLRALLASTPDAGDRRRRPTADDHERRARHGCDDAAGRATCPSHGGRTLAYVYDSGLAEADAVGREAVAAYAGDATGSTRPPSRRCCGWRTTSSASPAGCSTPRTRIRRRRSRPAAPSRSCSPCRPPATRARTSTAPRMVLPTTAHAAFHKAAHYFGVEPVLVDVDPDFRADPTRWPRPSTTARCSWSPRAPSYAHGVVDPVAEIAARGGRARGPLPRRRLHRRLGAAVRRAARPRRSRRGRSPSTGVTSISRRPAQVRLHPQGHLGAAAPHAGAATPAVLRLGPAGRATRCSTRRRSRRSPAARSPRPGRSCTTSATTATRRSPGTRATATLDLASAVDGIPGLRVVAPPDSTLVALVTDDSCDVFTISRRDARPRAGTSSRRCASATCRRRCT